MRVTSILQGASAGISVVSFENSLVDWNVKWRSTILMIDLACDCRKVAHFLRKSTGPIWPPAPNCEDIFNIETFFAWKTSAPKMDEGCLLWQTWSQH